MAAVKIDETGATALHRALTNNFAFCARTVYVAFDADFSTNPSVRQALIRVAVLLHKEGAEVSIGKLVDTLADRSVIIKLERKKRNQQVTRLRDSPQNLFSQICQKPLSRLWAGAHGFQCWSTSIIWLLR